SSLRGGDQRHDFALVNYPKSRRGIDMARREDKSKCSRLVIGGWQLVSSWFFTKHQLLAILPCSPRFATKPISSRRFVHGINAGYSMISPSYGPTSHLAIEEAPMRYRPTRLIWLSALVGVFWASALPVWSQSSRPWQRTEKLA